MGEVELKKVVLFVVLFTAGRIYSDLHNAGHVWWALGLMASALLICSIVFDRTWIERSKVAEHADKIEVATSRLRASLARYLNVTNR